MSFWAVATPGGTWRCRAGPKISPHTATVLACVLLSTGCNQSAPAPEVEQTEVPAELVQTPAQNATRNNAQADDADSGARIGTPLNERVATLGLLNKRNNISRDIELSPGESRRVGDVVLRLASCERTAPWESPPETGAFVQVFVEDRAESGAQARWSRVFSGWLFKNSPGLNVVEHPIYDVWVKDCAMSFPEEDAPVEPSEASDT